MKLVEKGTSFLKEFQNFAVKGNVMDMAIGVVIGTAFGKIVSSLVSDIIMPLIGLAVGSVDLKDLSVTLKAAEGENPNRLVTQEAAEAPAPEVPADVKLLTEIRDLLKDKK